MSSISSGDIISILKSEIENFDFDTRDKEVGTVIWVGDGIVTIYGIDNAMYGEIVVFENGIKGMVQDIQDVEKRVLTEWLPTSGYEFDQCINIEVYLDDKKEDSNFEVWLSIKNK